MQDYISFSKNEYDDYIKRLTNNKFKVILANKRLC